MNAPIKPRERDAIFQSLRTGVVPRTGLRHLQVGRRDEVAAVLEDLNRIERGVRQHPFHYRTLWSREELFWFFRF